MRKGGPRQAVLASSGSIPRASCSLVPQRSQRRSLTARLAMATKYRHRCSQVPGVSSIALSIEPRG